MSYTLSSMCAQVKPDQMQVISSLLVLLMIPVFESLVYPLLGKCNLLTRCEHRTCIHMHILVLHTSANTTRFAFIERMLTFDALYILPLLSKANACRTGWSSAECSRWPPS